MSWSWAEAVAARAAVDPRGVAMVVEGGDDLAYGAWEAQSNAVARGLLARGTSAGDRVGVLFDGPRWAEFAVAHLGVLKAGGVAVLLSPGAARPDLARALTDARAVGLVCAPHLVPPTAPGWVTSPAAAASGRDTARIDRAFAATAADDPGVPAELVYPLAPLAPARPSGRSHGELAGDPALEGGPGLVHAWAPGSLAGQHALRLVLRDPQVPVTALAAFHPDRLGAAVARRGVASCGLTPALAAAVVASGAAGRHRLDAVTRVLLAGPAGPGLVEGLRRTFPSAVVVDVGPARSTRPDGCLPPVAISQEPMLWHEQFAPGSFNLPCLVRRYRGPLDPAAMAWALSELVRRHPPLRTTFELVDGRPCQVVGDAAGLALATVDLGSLPGADRDAEAARLLADASGRPFDLAMGPLFEPHLIRLAPDDHLLVIRLHHTVFDDWSVDVFRRELSALYTARVAGAPSPLREPGTTFADASRRHAARRAERDVAERSWWRQELAGGPLAVQLPLGRDPAGTGPGEPLRVDLAPGLALALRALAPRLRATPFMTVLAAFSVLVARVTAQHDLVLATVTAARNATDVEPLVGCFTKKIPIRLRLEGDPTFGELVGRTRASLLGALSHQDLSFDAALQEGLGQAAADHGVVPHVAVVFQGETPREAKLALPGLTVGPYQAGGGDRRERHFSAGPDEEAAHGPVWGDGIYLGTFLILSLLETVDGMALVARGVFSRPEASRLLDDFVILLAEVAADPARRVSELAADPARPVSELAADRDPGPEAADDVVEVRGFRARRARLEAALARCPQVADVAVAVRADADRGPRLVAYVVAEGDRPPDLAGLRAALWGELPGALWPADAVIVDRLARRADGGLDVAAMPAPRPGPAPGQAPGGGATVDLGWPGILAAMWAETAGRPVTSTTGYWQDFSFLRVLAEVREAGLPIGDDQVARCRTPEALAVAVASARP